MENDAARGTVRYAHPGHDRIARESEELRRRETELRGRWKEMGFQLPQVDLSVHITAAAPASKVEAVVLSPTNMAAAKIAAVDFNKMTSLDRPAYGHVCWEDLLASQLLQTLLLL